MKSVLVTGATGFVGRVLCRRLLEEGFLVRGTLLAGEDPAALCDAVEPVRVGPLGEGTTWSHALGGVDTVIHLAARVHVMADSAADPLAEFRSVNVEGSARLAREAVRAGVRRLVFISSIKVNGEESAAPYSADSPETPCDPYGVSKYEAERALRTIEAGSALEVVVLRPTLVYGPGVKANFLAMLRLISRGVVLPLGSIENRRSLIYVGNLADALVLCAVHAAAAGKTYLVSDGEDVSTPELIRRSALALGLPARLIPFPVRALLWAGRLTGRSGAVSRLTGSLAVDSSRIRQELGWRPPYSMDQGLGATAQWFKQSRLAPLNVT